MVSAEVEPPTTDLMFASVDARGASVVAYTSSWVGNAIGESAHRGDKAP